MSAMTQTDLPTGGTTKQRRSVDVVIAEDSRIQAKMLERRLVEAGHTVRWAIDGAKALEMVRERRPAIIISDIEMPEMTGYQLCGGQIGPCTQNDSADFTLHALRSC